VAGLHGAHHIGRARGAFLDVVQNAIGGLGQIRQDGGVEQRREPRQVGPRASSAILAAAASVSVLP